jgi:hypothetical protein
MASANCRDHRQGMIDTKKAGEALCLTRLFEILKRAYSESGPKFVAEYLPRRSISMSNAKRSP